MTKPNEALNAEVKNVKTKPDVTMEVVAKVETVGSVTSNMSEVQKKANALREWYASLTISENDVPVMKEEKVQINKMKNAVADYRKKIVAEFKQPIMEFEETAKETEKILKEAYDSINDQINVYEEEKRQERIAELKQFFDERKAVSHLDWIEYEMMNQNVTLSASTKKLMVEITDFINLVSSHIRAIDTYPEEQRNDIMVEYKNSLNFADAVLKVQTRYKALEEEKARQEALKAFKAEEEKVVEKVEEVIAPVEVKEEKKYTASFQVRGTIDQLKDLKRFMEERGIEYVTVK
ncbi:MAG: DUF1351 domain-containing protein [Erysipelotrichaceae bacterium]|nr:DUF1351 domain-containing protein [Erysipelotrichaceae bacterium]